MSKWINLESILIVGDHHSFRSDLRTVLAHGGHRVSGVPRGDDALLAIQNAPYTAVFLDLDSDRVPGLKMCGALRERFPHLAILALVAYHNEDLVVGALEAGVDHCLTKPFKPRELMARLRSTTHCRAAQDKDSTRGPVRAGGIHLDPDKRLVRRQGRPVHLSPREFALLHRLMRDAGKPLTHSTLLKDVWGFCYQNNLEYLRTYIRKLRRKLKMTLRIPNTLQTEPHFGYRFCDHEPDY